MDAYSRAGRFFEGTLFKCIRWALIRLGAYSRGNKSRHCSKPI